MTRLVYIPGLGDGYDGLRSHTLKHWKRKDLDVELYPMKWRDGTQTLDEKLAELVDVLQTSESKIILVGESAGGSVVMNLLADYSDKVELAITLCGKNIYANRVSPRLYTANPAFKESMARADASVKRFSHEELKKLHIFYSEADPTVRPIDTIIEGAHLHTLPTAGHLLSILTVLTVSKRRIISLALKNPSSL